MRFSPSPFLLEPALSDGLHALAVAAADAIGGGVKGAVAAPRPREGLAMPDACSGQMVDQ